MREGLLPRLGSRGVAGVEYALVLPVFLVLVFGIIDTGLLMWKQVSLERATAIAARYGAINASGCEAALGNCPTQEEIIGTFDEASVNAGFRDVAIAVNTSADCGVSVTATMPFYLSLRIPTSSVQLKAATCHPLLK